MTGRRAVVVVLLVVGTMWLAMAGVARTKYQKSWKSLTRHAVPEWLQDAKFGIYAHWGVYAVPAHGNEWYAKWMYARSDRRSYYEWHRRNYGAPAEFGYKDFIPMFKAERYDPEEWADLIAKSGARYAGIAVVHHDGFGLWDSDVYPWNAGKMGPKRDLYGDLVKALRRKKDMRTLATFHHIRTFNWFLPSSKEEIEAGRRAGWDLFDPKYANFYWNRYTGKFEDFIALWQAKIKEVVDKYRPDALWFDGGKFQDESSQGIVLEVLSHYLNRAEEWGKEVEVLNKLPVSKRFNFPREFGMLTFEEGRDRPRVVGQPWVDDMKISTRSWGYIKGQKYKPINEIIDGLVDRVSRGGGLVLSLCPKADGTINREQRAILLAIGKWLGVNGEAIYGTRPWTVHAEGPEEKLIRGRDKKKRFKWVFDNCDAGDIRFTKKGNTLYAIALGWPRGRELTIKTLSRKSKIGIASVSLLGAKGELKWSRDEDGLTIKLPRRKPCEHAHAFRIRLK